DKLIRSKEDYTISRVMLNNQKMESWGSKGTIATNAELRDCLKAENPAYGNGVFLVGKAPKGDRKYLYKNWERNGIRCYSSLVSPVIGLKPHMERGPWGKTNEINLPRKFVKLVNFCRKDEVKVSEIYNLMYNPKLYEIAYHKLKLNPVNMTSPQIRVGKLTPTMLDRFSLELIEEIIYLMKSGRFDFKPGRGVQIPQINGSIRPLPPLALSSPLLTSSSPSPCDP